MAERLVRHCTEDDGRGRPVARLLIPEPDDYFVLKPKHSAFFAIPLETLLKYLGGRGLRGVDRSGGEIARRCGTWRG